MSGTLLPLTPLELAAGSVWGEDPAFEPLPEASLAGDPVPALETVLLSALRQPPLLVSFSGGRDSSALLALATRVARREGLSLPVPTTLRFPGRPETEESDWQELLVRELRIPDWTKHVIEDDLLDVVGPVALGVLQRHGVLWPANVYVHMPLVADARGGTLVTGFDGDSLFGDWQWARAASVLFARARPTPFDALRVLHAVAPHAVQTRVAVRRHSVRRQWLRPEVDAAVRTAEASERVAEPFRWDRRIAWWARRRYLGVACESLRLIAEEAGARILHPFLDPVFLATFGKKGGRAGFASRTEATSVLFRDLLPPSLVARRHKAHLGSAFWGRYSAEFRERWQGSGVPHDLVDPDGLRREWAKDIPHMGSASLLQAACFAASTTRQLEQQLSRSRD
jgi:asparagine synthetase B (glutamine-hydrolysing)